MSYDVIEETQYVICSILPSNRIQHINVRRITDQTDKVAHKLPALYYRTYTQYRLNKRLTKFDDKKKEKITRT